MKRMLVLLLAIVLSGVASLPLSAASSNARIAVEIGGQKLGEDAYVVGGRTLVPLRAIFEKLQAKVDWASKTQTVTATKGTTVIVLRVNDVSASVNQKGVTLDVPPMVIDQAVFVPLRFVSEALGATVGIDTARNVITIQTSGNVCNGGIVHSGTINPAGETWTACGSPHFVKDDFIVGGLNSPVLTIEAGAVVRFEKDASLRVGEYEPGGLVIQGTAAKPVVLTADSAGPKPGYWKGIHFGEAAMLDRASINGARIEYAGGDYGALHLNAADMELTLTLKDTEIKNSLFAGIQMAGDARLSEKSGNIKISGTAAGTYGGGFPIITDLPGSNLLPQGTYTGNDIDAVRITSSKATYDILTKSTTWRNVGVPYDSDITITVEGPANPVLTIEPGITTVWGPDTFLEIANSYQGRLEAVGTREKPIVFTGSVKKKSGWMGIVFGHRTVGDSIQLQHAAISYASNGVTMYEDLGPIVQDTSFKNNGIGVFMPLYEEGQTDFRTGLGNTFEGNDQDQNIE